MSTLWICDLDNTLVHTTRDLQGDHGRLAHLTLVPGAREFLDALKARGDRCVLVTVGPWAYQTKKIQRLGLGLRSTILSPLPNKNGIYPDLPLDAKEHTFSSYKKKAEGAPVVVVGDRLDRDIAPAKRLGLATVRIRLPEGKYSSQEPQTPEETPDCEVADFFELLELLSLLYLAGV